MTDTEKRRIELLAHTRNAYQDKVFVPAIHPRYGNVYSKLYHSNNADTDMNELKSTFRTRLLLAILLFVVYASADLNSINIGEYSCYEFIEVVSQNIEVENVWNSW